MKSKFHCFHLLPVLAAGLMIAPLAAQSPERPAPPPTDASREAPQPERIQAAVRQMVELQKAGKHEEARAISQRLRGAAKGNPETAKQIHEAMREQRQPQPAAKAPEAPRGRPAQPGGPEGPQRRPQLRQHQPDQPQPPQVRPNSPGAPQRPMMRPNAPGAPQRPMMRPNAPQPPQCPMARPNGTGPKPPVVRPRVEAAKQSAAGTAKAGEVAKVRHLKQAAEHLAAAGFTEQAAMARKEIGRMEAAIKAAPKPPQTPKPQLKEQREHKETKDQAKAKEMKDQAKHKSPERPDVNERVVAELKKLGKQMAELSSRVRKLEARGDAKRD